MIFTFEKKCKVTRPRTYQRIGVARATQFVVFGVHFFDQRNQDSFRDPVSQVHRPLHQVVIRDIVSVKGKIVIINLTF